jgi:hypothetical protein
VSIREEASMQKALRRFDPLSSLNVVFVITLATVLAACIYVVMGVLHLLDVDAQGIADPRRFVDRLK